VTRRLHRRCITALRELASTDIGLLGPVTILFMIVMAVYH